MWLLEWALFIVSVFLMILLAFQAERAADGRNVAGVMFYCFMLAFVFLNVSWPKSHDHGRPPARTSTAVANV